METGKRLSCGVLIIDEKENILMLHATGQAHWDLPKGTQDAGESPLDTAIRELKEETGIDAKPSELIELGWYEYNRFKDLFMFLLPVSDIDVTKLKCNSFFINHWDAEVPEADEFKMIAIKEAQSLMCNSMARLFENSLERDLKIMLSRYKAAIAA